MMKSNLYIPKIIKVGFQERKDTFTGKLGFVTYIDDKGQLRQEKSWNDWRDNKIAPREYKNEPQSNFVFNKDVSRNSHWSDITKVRIFDTRDFEFEIDVSNMMYILMHSDISKRDIIEDCVFAWNGKNLILLPVNSEEYRNSIINTKKQNAVFSFKSLVLGHTYSTKKQGDVIYVGYHDWSELKYIGHQKIREGVGKKHIFSRTNGYGFVSLEAKELAEEINTDIHPKYAQLIENLQNHANMKKTGSFSVTKGFDKIGYKKTGYDMFKVVIMEHSSKEAFNLYTVTCSAHNDEPKVNSAKEIQYWRRTTFYSEMKNLNIDISDPNEVKQFFLKKGFGVLNYKKTTGEKILIE